MAAWLGLYDPPFAAQANDALWQVLRDHAAALGLSAPELLDRNRDHHAIWAEPALAFAQTCGLPLTTSLQGRVRLIAAPAYAFPGCDGADYRSFIVVRDSAPYAGLADLKGVRAAINSLDSHSGYTALRHAVAPLARGRCYFGTQVVTGAHVHSLQAVASGTADVCACDCVTFGLIDRHRPDWLEGLRVLAHSEAAPAPPYVTSGLAYDEDVQAWREALARTFADPRSAQARAVLGLQGFHVPALETYRRISEMAALADDRII